MSEFEITEYDYGDECYFGGEGRGMITVGDWIAGGVKQDAEAWAILQKEAQIISKALTEAKERGEL